MAEMIQFNCPACGTLLRLPLAMAAQQGPCPNCDREIVAPDPDHGFGAYEIPLPPPPKEIEPFRPFADPPPARPPAEEPVPVCEKPQRAILVLSCLLSAAVALAIGYWLGVRSNQYFMKVPPMNSPMIPPPKVEKPVAVTEVKPTVPEPNPVLVKPEIESPKVEKKPESVKASAAAEASLRAFLEAPDWAARAAYVLYPGKLRSAMEGYSRIVPDGPTPYKSVSVKQSQIDEKTGNTLLVFYVMTESFPEGFPVAVQETPVGWLVDWQTFVEFRDNLFQQFVDGPLDQTGRFHLIVTTPPTERAANTENEHFSSFLLKSPVAGKPLLAFVKKDSETFATFQVAMTAGGIFTPVLEVAKRKTADGKTYFEVVKVAATDWLPREN